MSAQDAYSEPISIIINKLNNLDSIEAVDVGCGAARYDMLLYRYFGDKLKLTCLDANDDMLKNLSTYFTRHGVRHFSVKSTTADTMPFPENSLDCIFTLNAVHNFDLPVFFKESARVIKSGGYLFIYTRLCQLNEQNTWGIYFPRLDEKENRLYPLAGMKQSLEAAGSLAIESIAFFAYSRMAAIEQLVIRAGSPDPSLYTQEQLKEALKVFSIDLTNVFEDTRQTRYFNENILFIIKKKK